MARPKAQPGKGLRARLSSFFRPHERRDVSTGRFAETGPWWNFVIGYRPKFAKGRKENDYGHIFIEARRVRKPHTTRSTRPPIWSAEAQGIAEAAAPKLLGFEIVAFLSKHSEGPTDEAEPVGDGSNLTVDAIHRWEVWTFEDYDSYRSRPVPKKVRAARERHEERLAGVSLSNDVSGLRKLGRICLAELNPDGTLKVD